LFCGQSKEPNTTLNFVRLDYGILASIMLGCNWKNANGSPSGQSAHMHRLMLVVLSS